MIPDKNLTHSYPFPLPFGIYFFISFSAKSSAFLISVETFVTALVAVVLIFTFLFRVVTIVGGSMQNTFYSGEKIVITKKEKSTENVEKTTKGFSFVAAQRARNQRDKVFCVNVVSNASPTRMRKVLLISLGITTLPKSSILLTIPVAFIYPFLLVLRLRTMILVFCELLLCIETRTIIQRNIIGR